jgi:hypothetical protein
MYKSGGKEMHKEQRRRYSGRNLYRKKKEWEYHFVGRVLSL